jgi:hypothetical protein
MPVATLAPLNAKHSRVRSVRDYAPQSAGGVSLGGGGPHRLSSIWLVLPFGLIGGVLFGFVVWGVARVVRNRRLQGPRGGALPPLPRSGP